MRKKKIFVVLYILIILWVTLFSREREPTRVFTGLFWEIEMGYWIDIRLNILLFLPLGVLLGTVTDNWRIVLFGFILSVFVEFLQYIFAMGWCQADDVLNNTIGTAVGIGVWKMFSVSIEKWKNKRVWWPHINNSRSSKGK